MNKAKLYIFIFLSCLIFSSHSEAQRRQKPGSMKHTNEEVENVIKETAITCRYISNNHTFYSEVGYGPGGVRPMKIGTATMVLKNGKYILSFKSITVKTTSNSWDVPRNHWWKENMLNNFTMTGKFETFERGGKSYLRLYDDETGSKFPDIELSGKDAKTFVLYDDGVEFNFKLQ